MRHGWAYIYGIPPASSRFDELVDHFSHDGIILGNPSSGDVTRVSPIGDPIPSSREDIRQECGASKVVCFNFYIAPSDNIFCSIEKIKAKIVREAFDLSAKNEGESFRIIRSLAQLFSKRAEKGRRLVLWQTDMQNFTNVFIGTISSLGGNASQPNGPSFGDAQKSFAK